MKKIILVFAAVCLSGAVFAQSNLVKDGSFESLSTGDQMPRIAAFTDLGGVTQTANPTGDEESVVKEVWYRKASNTGYLKAMVTDEEARDGDKALKLSVNKNSGQQKLDSWYSNTLIQFLTLENNTEYTVRFYARSLDAADKLYVGLLGGGNLSPVKGSKWISISPEWQEYSLTIKTKSGSEDSAVILGLPGQYDDNDKTIASAVLIDGVSVTVNR